MVLAVVFNANSLPAQNPATAKVKPAFLLTVQDNLISLKATDASLIEVLEEIGRRIKIEVVAPLREQEKVTTEFNQLPLEEAIKKLTPNYSHAMVSDEGGKKISKVIILQKSNTVLSKAVVTVPEPKKEEKAAKPVPSVKQEIAKQKLR